MTARHSIPQHSLCHHLQPLQYTVIPHYGPTHVPYIAHLQLHWHGTASAQFSCCITCTMYQLSTVQHELYCLAEAAFHHGITAACMFRHGTTYLELSLFNLAKLVRIDCILICILVFSCTGLHQQPETGGSCPIIRHGVCDAECWAADTLPV